MLVCLLARGPVAIVQPLQANRLAEPNVHPGGQLRQHEGGDNLFVEAPTCAEQESSKRLHLLSEFGCIRFIPVVSSAVHKFYYFHAVTYTEISHAACNKWVFNIFQCLSSDDVYDNLQHTSFDVGRS